MNAFPHASIQFDGTLEGVLPMLYHRLLTTLDVSLEKYVKLSLCRAASVPASHSEFLLCYNFRYCPVSLQFTSLTAIYPTFSLQSSSHWTYCTKACFLPDIGALFQLNPFSLNKPAAGCQNVCKIQHFSIFPENLLHNTPLARLQVYTATEIEEEPSDQAQVSHLNFAANYASYLRCLSLQNSSVFGLMT